MKTMSTVLLDGQGHSHSELHTAEGALSVHGVVIVHQPPPRLSRAGSSSSGKGEPSYLVTRLF